jgi:hypothetical protein
MGAGGFRVQDGAHADGGGVAERFAGLVNNVQGVGRGHGDFDAGQTAVAQGSDDIDKFTAAGRADNGDDAGGFDFADDLGCGCHSFSSCIGGEVRSER